MWTYLIFISKYMLSERHNTVVCISVHRALCSLFQPDTDGTRVSKCRQLFIETALGQILVFAGLHTGVSLHPPLPSIIFSPADQGTFSKTAGQSQAYYNT